MHWKTPVGSLFNKVAVLTSRRALRREEERIIDKHKHREEH